MLRHVGSLAQQDFFDSARAICAHSLVGAGEMPCSICGQTGHNALSCHKQGAAAVEAAAGLTADAAAAGFTADGKHQIEAAQCHPSAESETSSAEPQAKKPRHDDVSKALTPAPLDLPKDDDVAANVVQVMGEVVKEVHRGLPLLLKEAGIAGNQLPLHEHPPLDIKAVVPFGDLSSYKEPWRRSRAVHAVASASMYEAGGNPFWFRHGMPDVADEFPRENVPWPLLCSYRDTLFAVPKLGDRILFPQTLLGYLKDPKLIDADFFPGNIVLICGTPTLWAMYLKFFQAMQTRDFRQLRLLWQCALTCTIRVRTGDSVKEALLDTIRISETIELRKKGCTDTFMLFCDKLKLLKKQDPSLDGMDKAAQLQHWQDMGIRHDGSAINRTMLNAVHLVWQHFVPRCAWTVDLIEREFGRMVVSHGYNKIMRLIQCSLKVHAGSMLAEDILDFLLKMTSVALKRNRVTNPHFFTLKVLDKQTDGSAGWIAMTLATLKTLTFIRDLGHELQKRAPENALAKELVEIVYPKLDDPFKFLKAFPAQEKTDESVLDVDNEAEPVTPIDAFVNPLSKGGGLCARLMHDIYDGSYDTEMKCLGSTQMAISEALDSNDAKVARIKGKVQEFVRLIEASGSVALVPSGSGAAPPMQIRELVQRNSESREEDVATKADYQKARDEVWKETLQKGSRKFVKLFAGSSGSSQNGLGSSCVACEAAFAKSGPVRSFVGDPKNNRRLFVTAADLCTGDNHSEPWKVLGKAHVQALQEHLQFMNKQNGPADLLMALDGRMRDARRCIEDNFEDRRHLAEGSITYHGTCARGTAPYKVLWNSAKLETILAAFPMNRSHLPTKEREAFYKQGVSCGERSTCDPTYTGVSFRSTASLPRCDPGSKRLMYGGGMEIPVVPDTISNAVGAGEPLIWQECKSVELWSALIDDLDIGAIFDCAPGNLCGQ